MKECVGSKDDRLVTDGMLDGVDIGETFNIDEVLLVGSEKGTIIGRPKVPGAQVSDFIVVVFLVSYVGKRFFFASF